MNFLPDQSRIQFIDASVGGGKTHAAFQPLKMCVYNGMHRTRIQTELLISYILLSLGSCFLCAPGAYLPSPKKKL